MSEHTPAQRLGELRGRPVISASTGGRLGRVRQVVIDLAGRRVSGFRFRCGGLLDRRWRVAAMQDVSAVTATAVVLPDAVLLREDEERPGSIIVPGRGWPVVDERGAPLGRLTDALADLETGRLIEVVVTPPRSMPLRAAASLPVPVESVRGGAWALVANDAAASTLRGGPSTPPAPSAGAPAGD